jgi:hypothetical protein
MIDAAWIGALVPVLLAIGAGLQWLWGQMQSRHKTSMDEFREIISRQDAQMALLQRGHEDCRQREMAAQRAIIYLHGIACNQAAAMRSAGMTVDNIKSLVELGIEDFGIQTVQDRELKQGSILSQAEAAKVQKRPS